MYYQTFADQIRAGKYEVTLPYRPSKRASASNNAWRQKEQEQIAQFMTDLEQHIIAAGVPAQYAKKVCAVAWESGHSGGYEDVLIHAHRLLEIFQG